jgi:TrmH RNA methyltransferase
LPYRIVPAAELEAVTESRHHEGVCIVARTRPSVRAEDLFRAPGPACVIGLVEVGNPHNVGAILRTAAHFGVRGVVFLGAAGTPAEVGAAPLAGEPARALPPGRERVEGAVRLPAAAARTAQGGAEWLDLAAEADVGRVLRVARAAGFAVAATSSHGRAALYEAALPPRLFLLLGAEDEGLPASTLAAADLVLAVPGTGQVESLNVAAAAALILGEHWRGRRERGRPAGAAGASGAPRVVPAPPTGASRRPPPPAARPGGRPKGRG